MREDFLARRPFFYENDCNSETKSRKIDPKCEMNRLSEGYNRAVDHIWGHIAKNGFLGKKTSLQAQKMTFQPQKIIHSSEGRIHARQYRQPYGIDFV